MRDLLTTGDIAALLQCDRKTVQNWIKTGKLKAIRRKHRYLTLWNDLVAFIRKYEVAIPEFPESIYDRTPSWYKKHPRKPENWHKWWSEEEKKFLIENYRTLGPKRIAQLLGRGYRSVIVYMSHLRKEANSSDRARTYISRRRRAARA